MQQLKAFVRGRLPERMYRPFVTRWRLITKPTLDPEALTRLRPVSTIWGLDRGTPIDLHYLQRFLAEHALDIRGRVLEVGDARYTKRFGGGRVTRSDVLHLTEGNPQATIVGDLATGHGIPVETFDCLIVTNTLRLVYDIRGAVGTCNRALRPGGVLLAHFTGVTAGDRGESWGPPGWHGEGDYWRFTSAAARRLCEECFPRDAVEVFSYGNVRTATASLYGLAAEDLGPEELEHHDPRFEVVICVRAVKPTSA